MARIQKSARPITCQKVLATLATWKRCSPTTRNSPTQSMLAAGPVTLREITAANIDWVGELRVVGEQRNRAGGRAGRRDSVVQRAIVRPQPGRATHAGG